MKTLIICEGDMNKVAPIIRKAKQSTREEVENVYIISDFLITAKGRFKADFEYLKICFPRITFEIITCFNFPDIETSFNYKLRKFESGNLKNKHSLIIRGMTNSEVVNYQKNEYFSFLEVFYENIIKFLDRETVLHIDNIITGFPIGGALNNQWTLIFEQVYSKQALDYFLGCSIKFEEIINYINKKTVYPLSIVHHDPYFVLDEYIDMGNSKSANNLEPEIYVIKSEQYKFI